jgi:hypothetical protein
MTLHHLLRRSAALVLIASLAACGGGGGGGSGGGFASYPSSGAYGWVLKANGNTGSLANGLSLVHPSAPDSEFVVELASVNVSDAVLVSNGSLDAANKRFNSLAPASLTYIRGGDVRSVPMQANGNSPASQIIRANTSSACGFATSAIDYATPANSRFLITTAGGDGVCKTGDDGLAEVRTQTGVGLVLTPLDSNARPFDVVRDPTTLAPRGWIYGRTVGLWTGASFNIRTGGQPALTYIVGSTYNQTLASDGAKLSVFTFTGGTAFSEATLDAGMTAGTTWSLIGFDANNFYVSSSSDFSSPWTVLKITRSSPTASVLATGVGNIQVSSMGTDVLYLTTSTATSTRLVRIAKTDGAQTPQDYPLTTFISIQTSNSARHLAWIATNIDTATGGFTSTTDLTIGVLDEATNGTLYSASGGFPLTVAEAASFSLDNSESRSRFIFATGFSPTLSANGASLVSYDAATGTAHALGALPASAEFGTDQGYAQAIAGPTSFGGAFAARITSGAVQSTGSKVYSFDALTENSLRATTVVVN